MPEIEVTSSVVGRTADEQLPPVTFEIASGSVTLGELIARAVEEQIRVLLAHHHASTATARRILDRQYLEERDVEACAAAGRVAMPHSREGAGLEPIDIGREVARALKAFEEGVFHVLVDGRPVSNLDEQIVIGPLTRTVFLRLMPLAGG